MLSLEYLLEEAENTGVPSNKRRAVVREYLQNIILNGVYKGKAGRRLCFMGGTALRFCYRLPRFSEDLDFNAKRLSYREFKAVSTEAVKSLGMEGFKAEVRYEKREKLYTAYVNLPEAMRQYGITDARGAGMMVKLEVNQPPWRLNTRTHAVSLYGLNYLPTVMSESSLITEKLCAMLNRNRGRDIYDLLFMLGRKFPFDGRILKANGFKEKPQTLLTRRLENLGQRELKRLALQVKPFLFKEDDETLVLNAPEYAKKFLEDYPG